MSQRKNDKEGRRVRQLIRSVDDLRAAMKVSKKALAERSDMPAASVRRLFGFADSNPTLATFARILDSLGLVLVVEPKRRPKPKSGEAPR